MATSLSAKKRIRQNVKQRARNRWRMITLRGALKDFETKLQHGSVDEAQSSLKTACQALDKTASRGVIHKNTAARRKSRLNARMKTRKATG